MTLDIQNSDYFAGYSTGSLQERKQENYPKPEKNSEFNKIINNQQLLENAHKPGYYS
jgi:hypothetical protein